LPQLPDDLVDTVPFLFHGEISSGPGPV
jgi:hypothetical protein